MLEDSNLRLHRKASPICSVIAVAAWSSALLIVARNPTVAGAVLTEFGADFGVTGVVEIITAAIHLLVITVVLGWRGTRAPSGLLVVFVIADVVTMIPLGLLSISVATCEAGAGILLSGGWLFAILSIVELTRARVPRPSLTPLPGLPAPLPTAVVTRASALIDAEVTGRLPVYGHLVVDPEVLDVALPLSGKASESGFAVLPRGSRTRVDGEVLRFFTYWRQVSERTDFDLSALLLDADFGYLGHVSWTNYGEDGAVYSGDIVDAPDGATEFIDIPLGTISAAYVVPQVNVYAGEGFDDVAESLFGWMTRDRDQAGAPFDARTVRSRSNMRGTGRVALPVMFGRGADGTWTATWTHFYLSGTPRFNQVEANRLSAGVLARGVMAHEYLTVGYLVDLLRANGTRVTAWDPAASVHGPVTFVGVHAPEGLPDGSEVITLDRLNELVPR